MPASNELSVSSVYEDSESSYKPSVLSTSSLDEHENSSKTSLVNLSLDPQIPVKSVQTKEVNYDYTVSVEMSKKTALSNKRIWDKKDSCLYCEEQVTNFTRHLARKHSEETEVGKYLALKKGSKERKNLVDQLRKRGNFFNNIGGAPKIKPVRRPNEFAEPSTAKNYLPCKFCFGLFKKNYLRRHIKKCSLKKDEIGGKRKNIQANAQSLLLAFSSEDTRLVEEVFPRMAPDEISLIVKNDPLIRAFGTRYIKCHREKHLIAVVSNKMRELGRFLLAMRESEKNCQSLQDCLKPELFDKIINCTKVVAGYDEKSDKFGAPSLVLKLGTSLKQCCDIAEYLLIKRSTSLCPSTNTSQDIANIKSVENLITKQWSYELSTNASKELYQKKWNKPAFLPLTSDIKIFRNHLLSVEKTALTNLKKNPMDLMSFRALQDTVLTQLILLNRRRAGEVQRMLLKTYLNCSNEVPQEEIKLSLSAVELELTKKFKRIVIRGKRGRGVPILFTPKMQKNISVLISIRKNFCDEKNEFLFAVPNNEESSLRASEIVRKMANASGAKNPSALTSTKLRKQVATVAQLLNFNDGDVEQLANFMGHSKDIHKSFYRLPENTFQIAKVSKFLLMMEKGEADQYRGKNFDEIDVNVDGLVSEESCNSDTDFSGSEEGDNAEETTSKTKTEMENILVKSISPQPKIVQPQISTPTTPQPRKTRQNKRTCKEKKFNRVPWTEEQKKLTTKYFQKHVLLKIPPKKKECDEFIKKNKDIFAGNVPI